MSRKRIYNVQHNVGTNRQTFRPATSLGGTRSRSPQLCSTYGDAPQQSMMERTDG